MAVDCGDLRYVEILLVALGGDLNVLLGPSAQNGDLRARPAWMRLRKFRAIRHCAAVSTRTGANSTDSSVSLSCQRRAAWREAVCSSRVPTRTTTTCAGRRALCATHGTELAPTSKVF